MADVLVIGGGISGLAAGLRLHKAGVDVAVFERAPQAGGHLRTIQRDGWRYEAGPNSFLGGAAAVHALAEHAGVAPVAARDVARKRYLFIDGRLQELPSSPLAAITSPILPVSAKLRLLKEPFLKATPDETESVRDFFTRHLGPEPTERFVDAFVSGIYGGDISKLGMAAAFPKVFEAVRQSGSIMRGMKSTKGAPIQRGTFSFAGGMGDLPKAIADKLGARLQTGVESTLTRNGAQWSFAGVNAPAAILATQADTQLIPQLNRIEYSPMAGIHLLFKRTDVPHSLDGFGFLVPRREKVRLLGCIWNSSLFDVCASDHVALTCFLGGAHDPSVIDLDDAALVQQASADLGTTLGIKAAPIDTSVVKHRRAIPQYGLQHIALRATIKQEVAKRPGLFLAGSFLDGVAMNDAIVSGNAAADKALERAA